MSRLSFVPSLGPGSQKGPDSSLWGDPFFADTFSDLVSVQSWDFCSDDEFLVVFPALVGMRPLPPRLLAHLKTRVDRLTARAVAQAPAKRGAGLKPVLSADDDMAASTALADLIQRIENDELEPFDIATAASVAFWCQVHPAYLWREALLSHGILSAIGWIGISMNGRDALLPAHIAETLFELIDVGGIGDAKVADPLLDHYVRSGQFASVLLRHSCHTMSGRRSILTAREASRPEPPRWLR